MPQGLPRKIRSAFVRQVIVAGLVMVFGMIAAAAFTRHSLAEYWLQQEAQHFRQLQARNIAPPDTIVLHGYFAATGAEVKSLPQGFAELRPGFHVRRDHDDMVLVDTHGTGRLYLTVRESQLLKAMFWLSLMPLVLSLLAIVLISWLTYRTALRMVEPVNWLAHQVAGWDPNKPDDSLAPERYMPHAVGVEASQLALALRGLRERLREFVQRERDFTRDASHELRTPLTVIRVATDLMMVDTDTTPRLQRSLSRVQRAGRDMEAVIDAFLILAREPEASAHHESFDVRDVVHEELDRVRPLLEDKPVELMVLDKGAPQLVAPPQVLGVMVRNLLNNAVQFTDEGRIELRMTPDRIEVRDTGVGMSESTLGKAFEPFYRADITRGDGKGMGLAVVRRLGERYGWPVTLSSIPGQGTTATIRFVL